MKTIDIEMEISRSGRRIFSTADIAKLVGSRNSNTVYKTAGRLVEHRILQLLNKGLYIAVENPPDLFEIANALYVPSYISLESALYRYGVIAQSPYIVTSVSTNKSRKKTALDHEYDYAHLDNKYFFGFIRDRRILIATKEKALLDLLYLVAKKSRSLNLDGIDWKTINRRDIRDHLRKYSFLPLLNLIKKVDL